MIRLRATGIVPAGRRSGTVDGAPEARPLARFDVTSGGTVPEPAGG